MKSRIRPVTSESARSSEKSASAEPADSLRQIVGEYFNPEYYLSRNPDVVASGSNPLDHYLRYGWKEGRNPSPHFDAADYLQKNPDLQDSEEHPLVHYHRLRQERTPEGRNDRAPTEPVGADQAPSSAFEPPRPAPTLTRANFDERLYTRLKDHFDEDYYLATNSDVAREGVDPLEHFLNIGGREGRKPSVDFDAAFYLRENPDVADSGVNPLAHYLQTGRNEGRLGRDPIRAEIRAVLEQSRSFIEDAKQAEETGQSVLTRKDLNLRKRLSSTIGASRKRIVLSFGHDSYTESCGGVQIFISDEQQKFNDEGAFYLNLAPPRPLPSLSRIDSPEFFHVNLTADGVVWGCASLASVQEALLGTLADQPELEVVAVIHSLLGHNVRLVANLLESISNPKKVVLWLHDFFTLCPSYALMRNDVSFCGAPEPQSQACQICAYGGDRLDHLAEIGSLFDRLSVTVAAPSKLALDFWHEHGDFPVERSVVHSHAEFRFTRKRVKQAAPARKNARPAPLRVAFCGIPVLMKGWFIFKELSERLGTDDRFLFHQLATNRVAQPMLHFKHVEVSRENRDAMTDALRDEEIDVVVLASHCFETFSFTAHEAISAGCVVVTLESSGNIAGLAESLDQVITFPDEAALIEGFADGSLYEQVRTMLQVGVDAPELEYVGTTASLAEVLG